MQQCENEATMWEQSVVYILETCWTCEKHLKVTLCGWWGYDPSRNKESISPWLGCFLISVFPGSEVCQWVLQPHRLCPGQLQEQEGNTRRLRDEYIYTVFRLKDDFASTQTENDCVGTQTERWLCQHSDWKVMSALGRKDDYVSTLMERCLCQHTDWKMIMSALRLHTDWKVIISAHRLKIHCVSTQTERW